MRKREVVNQMEFALCLSRDQTKWRYTKLGEVWRGKLASKSLDCKFLINFGINHFRILNCRK